MELGKKVAVFNRKWGRNLAPVSLEYIAKARIFLLVDLLTLLL